MVLGRLWLQNVWGSKESLSAGPLSLESQEDQANIMNQEARRGKGRGHSTFTQEDQSLSGCRVTVMALESPPMLLRGRKTKLGSDKQSKRMFLCVRFVIFLHFY